MNTPVNWKRELMSFMLFGVIALAVLGMISIVNWLPLAIQEGTIRVYAEVDTVKTRLSLDNLRIPEYFPEVIAWPPARILAQSKPCKAVLISFNSTHTNREGLVIIAAESRLFRDIVPDPLAKVTEQATYDLLGKTALLEVGTTGGGPIYSRIAWMNEGLFYTLTIPGPPFELIKIAESMVL